MHAQSPVSPSHVPPTNVSPTTTTAPTSIPSDHPLVEAIFRTLLYADVFDFPMTLNEIHHFLIGMSATRSDVENVISKSKWLAARISCRDGYYNLSGRGDLVEIRQQREAASVRLWPLARRWGVILSHLPFVRMVALTGALAVHNASDNRDDLDYLLVTAPRRVWTARALAVIMVRIGRVFGVGLCPNYVLAETALHQDRQDLFTAHEIAQMVPLTGLEIYGQMRAVNGWADAILPNAENPLYLEPDRMPRGIGRTIQRIGELILSGPAGDWFESWEQRRKLAKFAGMAQQPNASAQLDGDHVKGHFNDYGAPALQAYQQRLHDYLGEKL